jgi:hypothetical protein
MLRNLWEIATSAMQGKICTRQFETPCEFFVEDEFESDYDYIINGICKVWGEALPIDDEYYKIQKVVLSAHKTWGVARSYEKNLSPMCLQDETGNRKQKFLKNEAIKILKEMEDDFEMKPYDNGKTLAICASQPLDLFHFRHKQSSIKDADRATAPSTHDKNDTRPMNIEHRLL